MAGAIATVRQVVGSVVAIDEMENQRVVNSGDSLFLGETLKTLTSVSKAVISTNDGKTITILGNDSLVLDQSVAISESFGDESMANSTDIKKAILAGADLTELEETAAGGNGGTGDGTGTARLNDSFFISGGHYSNVNADMRNIDNSYSNNIA